MIPVMMPPVRKLTNLGAALLKSYDGETTFAATLTDIVARTTIEPRTMRGIHVAVPEEPMSASPAMVASARANLDHLQAMESFKRLVAPFDGIVTTRAVDVGALVLVGTPGATPLVGV